MSSKKLEFHETYLGAVNFYVYNSFSYASDVLKVDKRYFKDWNFGHFNTYINEAGSYYLKFETSYQVGDNPTLMTRTYTAANIQEQKVDPAVFHVDTTFLS